MLKTAKIIPIEDPHNNEEKRAVIDRILDEYKHISGSTMVVLNQLQGAIGHISPAMQVYVANRLGQPVSHIHGVVSFYSFFTTKPRGKHTIKFCVGTACYVSSIDQIIEKAKQVLGIGPGETTEDGLITLELCRCVGTCSQAPVVVIDEKIQGRLQSNRFPRYSKIRGKQLRELCLHILDIAANNISANADKISVLIDENIIDDNLTIEIADNGKGMNPETVKRVTDPFITSRTERNVGLGIPLLKFAAKSCNGWFKIDSEVDKGTKIAVQFQHSHVDRMPLDDIPDTLITLELCTPNVNWVYSIRKNYKEFYFDDTEFKQFGWHAND